MPSSCLKINHGHHRNLILTCCPICYVPGTGICPTHPCPSVLTQHKANYVLYEQVQELVIYALYKQEKKTCKIIPQSTCMTHIIWHGKNTVWIWEALESPAKDRTSLPNTLVSPMHQGPGKNNRIQEGHIFSFWAGRPPSLLCPGLWMVLVVGLHKGPGWKLLVLQILGPGT